MRFGLCIWSFSDVHGRIGAPLDPFTREGLTTLACESGLAAIEVGVKTFQEAPETAGPFLEDLRAKKLAVVLDTYGQEAPEAIGEEVERALEVAVSIGAQAVRTTVSNCLEGDRSRFGRAGWKQHLEALVQPLRKAASVAEELAVPFGIENHQDISSSELVWLCEQVDSSQFGVIFDTGNAFAVGEHPAVFAERVAPFLKHVQLKDYRAHPTGSGWRLVRCPLGDGVVNFRALIAQIDRQAPGLVGCIELGATSARHVRLLEEDWWSTYEPRPRNEVLAALRELHAHEEIRTLDWRTPHERDDALAIAAAYEMDQFNSSVTYLRELDALPL
jgi:3-oxoisoapionate decarboxylase